MRVKGAAAQCILKTSLFAIVASLGFLSIFWTPNPAPRHSAGAFYDLYLNDVGEAEAGAVFETAFALDDSCDGLRLWRFTTSTDKERTAVFKHPRWFIGFSGLPPHDFESLYGMSMMLSPGDDVNFSLSNVSAKEAVNKACFVAKHKGG
jgi:hypothetical protein